MASKLWAIEYDGVAAMSKLWAIEYDGDDGPAYDANGDGVPTLVTSETEADGLLREATGLIPWRNPRKVRVALVPMAGELVEVAERLREMKPQYSPVHLICDAILGVSDD